MSRLVLCVGLLAAFSDYAAGEHSACLEYRKLVAQGAVRGVDEMSAETLPFALKRFVPKGASVSFLGEGTGGGKVFLIRQGDEAFVLKHYFDAERALNDERRFSLIDEALASGPAKDSSFLAVRPKLVAPGVMKLPYVEGRTLSGFFNDSQVPVELKRNFSRLYQDCLKDLEARFRRAGRKAKMRDEEVLVETVRGQVALWLKHDNILVTPEGRLVIIDPF